MKLNSNVIDSENLSLAIAAFGGEDPHKGAELRKNSVGNVVGRRMSFIGEYPAGDVSKALKAQGIKGKALKREVRAVLAGKRTLAVASAVAYIIGSAEQGFCPVRVDSNKAGDVRTIRMEEGNLTSAEVKSATISKMTDAELLAELESRKQAKPVIDVPAVVGKPAEAPKA